jgi:Family of unknown function (DUF6677)
MANQKAVAKPAPQPGMMSVLAPLAGWLVPGLGHIIQRRWGRGALIFASVTVMFFCGLDMAGKVYAFNLGELLEMLGFVGDLGNGILYFAARAMDLGPAAIAQATGDYGTKFLICGGLLNVIAAIDAHHIAIGKKS